jgi:hypothetical protein
VFTGAFGGEGGGGDVAVGGDAEVDVLGSAGGSGVGLGKLGGGGGEADLESFGFAGLLAAVLFEREIGPWRRCR